MSHHWNESEVIIEHPGMQNLQRGQTTEYTGNILYETEGERFKEAVQRIKDHFSTEYNDFIINLNALPIRAQWEELKRKFGEGLKTLVDEYVNGGNQNILDHNINVYTVETLDNEFDGTNPPHTNYEQVRGAAEVFNLISSDPVTDNEISYEQRREYALEQMRKNCVYQFCMLLAGFTNVNMNKYWVTPSETTMGIDRSASNTVVTKENTKVKARIIYYLPANQGFQTPTVQAQRGKRFGVGGKQKEVQRTCRIPRGRRARRG